MVSQANLGESLPRGGGQPLAANGVSQSRTDMPIAIVGMSCRFPGEATSPERLWELCTSAKSAWSEIPQDRWNKDTLYHPDGGRTGTTNVRGGHFLSQDIALFDAPFFNMSAEEAKAMDPQIRLQLEVCYEALENAGIPLEKIAGTKTAMFSGIFTKDYTEGMLRDIETLPRYYVTGTGTAMVANRVSYFFDLKGPSMSVDTGCSTSLVALHLACQSIRSGESEAAMVGGSNVILNPDLPIALSNMGFLSPEGRSYAFDHRAQGYGRGEGAACIIIKPLDKALKDGDHIHSIIRQTAVNSDGKTDGITQPSSVAHERLIRFAYDQVNLDPSETDYLEAHGTGTQAGDPLELKAFGAVFGSTRTERNPVYVGSVKTNVGHLEAASGLAGVIKASMALDKAMIPPNINFEKVNEKIPLQKYNLRVPLRPTPWPTSDGPRRASVSSLGYGGTNAHVILESAHSLHTNKLRHINGASHNGYMNALNGSSNGHFNGHIDSNNKKHSDGHVNGHPNSHLEGGYANGHANSHANSHANGHLNCHLEGVYANGHANSHANGHVNGHPNGHLNEGYADGHANGANSAAEKCSNGYRDSTDNITNAILYQPLTSTDEQLANKWRIFAFSAKDEQVLHDSVAATSRYLQEQNILEEDEFLDNLSFTLGQRRSALRWVQAFPAKSVNGLIKAMGERRRVGTRRAEAPRIGFVFTGQGAQWHAMGRELIQAYPVFGKTMQQADDFLKTLGCPWSLVEELYRDAKSTQVNAATVGQPLCTAVQIGLVNLLASWNIKPTGVTGHSSGEIAAAYAAGALSLESAMMAAYHRGAIAQKSAKISGVKGSMIAVGLSREKANEYIKRLTTGKVVVACINSPASVTVSGDLSAIEEIQTLLDADGVFARRLKVNTAYHSHHMLLAMDGYLEELQEMQTKQISNVLCVSSVTGRPVTSAKELGASYWVKNAIQPVEFSDSLTCLCRGGASDNAQDVKAFVDILIEIGPHGALAAPIRQILQDPLLQGMPISYQSCLTRNQDARESIQAMASALMIKGVQVDLKEVNFPFGSDNVKIVTNIPSYPWSHKTRYWHEPRINRQQRQRQHARHDLLGVLSPGQNPSAKTWRHFVRLSDQPWVKDHVVDSNILYPAAGFIAMAIEAVMQISGSIPTEIAGYCVHEMKIMSALVVPESSDGTEVQLTLFPSSEQLPRAQQSYEFRILSVGDDDEWHEHCTGRIGLEVKSPTGEGHWKRSLMRSSPASSFSLSEQICTQTIDTKHYYDGVQRLGITYGPTFQNLVQIRQGPLRSLASVEVQDIASQMPSCVQQPHIIHPTTLDAIFQSIYPAISDSGTEHKSIMIPTFVKSLFIAHNINRIPGSRLKISTKAERNLASGAKASLSAVNDGGDSLTSVVEIEELVLSSVGNSVEVTDNENIDLCFDVDFARDISFLTPRDFATMSGIPVDPEERRVASDLQRACFHIVERALDQLNDQDTANLTGHHLSMYKWMCTQRELAHQGKLDFQDSAWLNSNEDEQAKLISAVASETVNGDMCVRVGNHLVDILRKQIEPLEVMMQGGLLYKYYENALGMQRIYGQMSKILRLLAHKNPEANILEIGGGTGGCTLPALQALTGDEDGIPRFAHYDFTDISSGFFEKAHEKLAKWENRLGFKKFDVEVDAESQGFDCGKYDLIIACNVLHATANMDKTMANVRKLLRPGGRVLIVEGTRDTLDISLVFGVLPGWWLGQEEERRLSPKLPIPAWDSLLRRNGFTGHQALLLDGPSESDHVYSVFLSSTSMGEEPKEYPAVSLVLGQQKPAQQWLDLLSSSIETLTGHSPSIIEFGKAQTAGGICIFLAEMDDPVLARLQEDEFLAVRTMLTSAKGIFWITCGGAMDCDRPEAAMVTGLVRTLRTENAGIRYITLDLDAASGPYTSKNASIISKVFEATFKPGLLSVDIDLEYVERDGQVFIPRVRPNRGANTTLLQNGETPVVEEQPFYQADRPLLMEAGTPGLLDTLRFVDDLAVQEPLPEDFVEVAPKAFGLNFRDVMIAIGQLNETIMGYECAGVVTRVGSKVTHLKVGDRVAAMMRGHYANYIRLLGIAVAKIPDDIPFEQATSMPMVFCTAYFSLYDTAHLQKGETVLIHAAAGGVGQAAIMLAQLAGAEVYATVGSKEKSQLLQETYGIPEDHIFTSRNASFATDIMTATNGKGVDVALNCLSGQLLNATWKCMAMFGRLVEIGKRDIEINSRLEMSGFQGNISFSAIDLTYMGRFRPARLSSILEKCMKLASEGKIRSVKPVTVFPISEIERAFRFMQAGKHMGKVVIKPNEGDIVRVLARRAKDLFRADSSYVIVGGLGGLGQSLSRWMSTHGAKNIIILSRSGMKHTLAKQLSSDLERAGCRVLMPECDITDVSLVKEVLSAAEKVMPPIRGVIQGAMVLSDCIFEHMSFSQYQSAVLPKVQGIWNLHHALSQQNLDFFVMLSSAVGIVGNSSQANYAAGSAFLDGLARHRRSLGLPALSLDLGIINSVGYVAENEDVAKRLARKGHDSISEEKMLALIQLAIADGRLSQRPSQLVTGLSTRELEAAWIQDSKFSILRSSQLSDSSSAKAGSGANAAKTNLQDGLGAVKSIEEAVTVICDGIVGKLAHNLMVSDADIDVDQPVTACGVDSLVAVELRNWLLSQTGAEVSVIDVMRSKSLVALSENIAKKSKVVAKSIGSV